MAVSESEKKTAMVLVLGGALLWFFWLKKMGTIGNIISIAVIAFGVAIYMDYVDFDLFMFGPGKLNSIPGQSNFAEIQQQLDDMKTNNQKIKNL